VTYKNGQADLREASEEEMKEEVAAQEDSGQSQEDPILAPYIKKNK
jgi:hypothetical protein